MTNQTETINKLQRMDKEWKNVVKSFCPFEDNYVLTQMLTGNMFKLVLEINNSSIKRTNDDLQLLKNKLGEYETKICLLKDNKIEEFLELEGI